jgi:hypothetical protein
MKAISCLLFFSVFVLPLAAQPDMSERERSDIKELGIRLREQYDYKYAAGKLAGKGNKSCRITYDSEGRIRELINFKNDTAVLNVSTYTYDNRGNRTEYVKYIGNRKTTSFKQNFQYDNKGNKLLETGFNGVDNYKNIFYYNPEGKLQQIKYYTGQKLDEIRTFTYLANTTEVKVADGFGNILFYLQTRYDQSNRPLEEIRLDKERKEINKTSHTYDAAGNDIKEVEVLQGRPGPITSYIYDAAGRLVEVYYEEPGTAKYLKQSFQYTREGRLQEQQWRNSPTADLSYKKYSYDYRGRQISVDCYFASYKFKVLNRFSYEFF